MFKKSKSKVLVDSASEEDDMSWHYHHSYKDKDIEGEEEEEEAAVSKLLQGTHGVHGTYFMTCPVCEAGGGRDGEGKETQHSFEELGLLDGNNHRGRKTRLKIATDCSATLEGYISFTVGLFMLILGHTKVDMESSEQRLPFTVKGHTGKMVIY